MGAPRKATSPTGPPDLGLYALAQARAAQLLADMPKCKSCTRTACPPPRDPVLGREGWPMCPVRMISQPPWTDAMALYRAAKLAALGAMPRVRLSAWGLDALLEVQSEVIKQAERESKTNKPSGDLPRYAGRRRREEN